MRKHFLSFVCLVVLKSYQLSGQSFEGVIKTEYVTNHQGETSEMMYFLQPEKAAMEMKYVEHGNNFISRFIFDKEKQMLSIKSDSPDGKFFYEVPIEKVQVEDRFSMMGLKVYPKPDVAKIEGYNCKKYIFETNTLSIETWIAEDIQVNTKELMQFMKSDPVIHILASENIPGFPLQSNVYSRAGVLIYFQLAKSIEIQQILAEEFEIGKDYILKSMN